MIILKSQKPGSIPRRLAIAMQHADCLGLPSDDRLEQHKIAAPNHQSDGWKESIIDSLRKNHQVTVDQSLHINTHMHRLLPELMGQLATGKKVLWITSGVNTIINNLKDPSFKDYYGFHGIVNSHSIEAAPGEKFKHYSTFPVGEQEHSYADILEKLAGVPDFDLAFVGVGIMGKLACHYIKAVFGKTAIDVGSMMSALQGLRNRSDYIQGGMREYLVWDPANPSSRI